MNLQEAWEDHVKKTYVRVFRRYDAVTQGYMRFDAFRAGWLAAGGTSDPLEIGVDSLSLGVRALNGLALLEVGTIRDLIRYSPRMLFERVPNMGRVTVKEIEDVLALHGLSLPPDDKPLRKRKNSLDEGTVDVYPKTVWEGV